MTKKIINENITVTAVTFRRNFDAIPQRIEYRGEAYTFLDSGIRYLIKNGGRISQLFDMTDGKAHFRLRQDAGNWTLVTITQ